MKNLTGKLFASIRAFLTNLEVVENGLIPLSDLDEPFRGMAEKFYQLLEQFRLLTYGQLISRAVAELGTPAVAGTVQATLRHLIVDEYQDVNPAQERLIRLLTRSEVELYVLGDDDQAIYQWRGSDVGNIVEFANRSPEAPSRSRRTGEAARAAWTLRRRRPLHPRSPGKEMLAIHEPAPLEIVTWAAETEAEECDRIADTMH